MYVYEVLPLWEAIDRYVPSGFVRVLMAAHWAKSLPRTRDSRPAPDMVTRPEMLPVF